MAALPDTAARFAAFDVSMLADILVAAALVATEARHRALRRRRSSAPKADDDDADGPAFALARAA